jgi:hypothetical protein
LPAENKFLKYILTYFEKSVNEIIFQSLGAGVFLKLFSYLRVMRSNERIALACEGIAKKITLRSQSK